MVFNMINKEIICPYCGSRTPNFNFCANCGQSLQDIDKEKPENSEYCEEIIKAALTVSETSKSRWGGQTKNIFFTTNYILEDKGASTGFFGATMSMEENGVEFLDEEINEKIDINQIQQEHHDLKLIPYSEIEKAEFYITRWNTYLKIKTPFYSPQYLLGAKKYSEAFLKKIISLLEPKIGDKFHIK